jgi:hypothetical protein
MKITALISTQDAQSQSHTMAHVYNKGYAIKIATNMIQRPRSTARTQSGLSVSNIEPCKVACPSVPQVSTLSCRFLMRAREQQPRDKSRLGG